jgi:hypothetical protein
MDSTEEICEVLSLRWLEGQWGLWSLLKMLGYVICNLQGGSHKTFVT